jgi:predicted TIM-barrel fold metal-dependent hydrolase
LKSRAPRVERVDGKASWVVDGVRLATDGAAVAQTATERLAAMDAAGIHYSALYPTVAGIAGEAFGRLSDPELELACVRAFNDWLIDEWAAASDRFIPQCLVPIYPPDATATEIRRAVERGHRGVIFPALPMELRAVPHVNEPEYDVVWSTCEELGVPLCLHAGSAPRLAVDPPDRLSPALAGALGRVNRSAAAIFDVASMLFSRILMRHPGLRVVFAESGLGWAPFMMEVADNQFERDRVYLDEGWELRPSELFKRQCFFTSWYDDGVADFARHIGAGNIMWAANMAQPNTSWPDCQSYIERCFAGVAPPDRARILWDNAAALYGIAPRP